eukprot:g1525.t1
MFSRALLSPAQRSCSGAGSSVLRAPRPFSTASHLRSFATISGFVSRIDERRYGFIRVQGRDIKEGNALVHFRMSQCEGRWVRMGDEVTFEESQDEKTGKPTALNVQGGTGSKKFSKEALQERKEAGEGRVKDFETQKAFRESQAAKQHVTRFANHMLWDAKREGRVVRVDEKEGGVIQPDGTEDEEQRLTFRAKDCKELPQLNEQISFFLSPNPERVNQNLAIAVRNKLATAEAAA